jgi:hypothetical protein
MKLGMRDQERHARGFRDPRASAVRYSTCVGVFQYWIQHGATVLRMFKYQYASGLGLMIRISVAPSFDGDRGTTARTPDSEKSRHRAFQAI